jgi:hypothetical protein
MTLVSAAVLTSLGVTACAFTLALHHGSAPAASRGGTTAQPVPPSYITSTSGVNPQAIVNGFNGGVDQPLALTTRDHQNCPRVASACVDLAEHLTWLQADGKVSYGPVPMEPGATGTVHATPTGTFNVAWKAGPTYVSTSYHELIPWAVFFAPGGIAFHEGSLTSSSHGCVHLTMDAAYYYNQHLPVGAEVVVF